MPPTLTRLVGIDLHVEGVNHTMRREQIAGGDGGFNLLAPRNASKGIQQAIHNDASSQRACTATCGER